MSRFFILFIFLFNSLSADQEQFGFIGLIGSSDKVSFVSDADLNNETETAFGLRFGRQTQDYRTVFTVAGSSNQQSVAVEADVFITDDMFGVPEIRPYLGGTLGYMNYDEDQLDIYREDLPVDINGSRPTDTSGLFYGLNVGFVFYVTDNIDLDVSYHYYFIDKNDLDPLENMHGVSVALHYFY
jgi:hypothetical protein